MDAEGSPTLLNCLMYKLSYYKFGELKVRLGHLLSMSENKSVWCYLHFRLVSIIIIFFWGGNENNLFKDISYVSLLR